MGGRRTRLLAVAVLSIAFASSGTIPAGADGVGELAASAKKSKKRRPVSGAYGGSTSQGGSLAITVSKERAKFPPMNIDLNCLSASGETGSEVQTVGPFSLKVSRKGRADGTRFFNGGRLSVEGRFSAKSFRGSLTFTGTTLGGAGLPVGSLCVTNPPVGLTAGKLPKF